MPLESPGGKPGATLALRAGAAAPVIARAPLAPLPPSDRLLPLVEWVEFARVESVPRAGEIVHALETWQEPAGGGPVAAAQLARLAGSCLFFTALGADELGRRSRSELTELGIDVRAIPDPEPTRRAFTYVDGEGERAQDCKPYQQNRDDAGQRNQPHQQSMMANVHR